MAKRESRRGIDRLNTANGAGEQFAHSFHSTMIAKSRQTDQTKLIKGINPLWEGSIMHKDGALQLLLIIDYIVDYARDIFRPSILMQLKSIGTGTAYDEISLTADDDIFPMNGDISSWDSTALITLSKGDHDNDRDSTIVLELDHQSLLPIVIPNTKFGSVRSASIVNYRFISLHITEHNVTSLLKLAGGPNQREDNSSRVAKELVHFITRWDELLVLRGTDLDELEWLWTGQTRPDEDAPHESQNAVFYVFLEYRCYMNSSWDIVKELTCLATTKPAFEILTSYADFKTRPPGSKRLADTLRPCWGNAFYDSVECLRNGSPWQTLLAAISATLISVYPLPLRNKTDVTQPVDILGFSYIKYPRLKPFVQKYLRLGRKLSRTVRREKQMGHGSVAYQYTEMAQQNYEPTNPSFHRRSERRIQVHEDNRHILNQCSRCRQSNTTDLFLKGFEAKLPPVLSEYGAILVESLRSLPSDQRADRHDLCLFFLKVPPNAMDEYKDLPVIVESLLKTDLLYHTILHRDDVTERITQDIVWNLPWSYRPPTMDQRADIVDWILELGALYISPKRPRKLEKKLWDQLQVLLMYLNKGYSYLVAMEAATQFWKKKRQEERGGNSAAVDIHELYARIEHEPKGGKDAYVPPSFETKPAFEVKVDVEG